MIRLNTYKIMKTLIPKLSFCLLQLLLAFSLLYAPHSLATSMVTGSEVRSLYLDITNAGQRLVAVGQHGHVIYSDDNGQNWWWAETPTDSLLTSVYFVDAQHGWATGHDGIIIHSNDGGLHWTVQLNGLALAKDLGKQRVEDAGRSLEEAEQRLADARASGDHNIDLELELDDAKVSLELAELAIHQTEADPFMDIWFQNSSTGIAVGAFGTVVLTHDGGQTWQDISDQLDNFDGYHLYSISANHEGRILIAGEAGSLFRSDDMGSSWETLSSPYEGSFFGVNVLSSNDVIIYGLRGNLLFSSDFGNSWKSLKTGTESSLFSAFSTGERVMIVGDAGVKVQFTQQNQSIETAQFDNRLPVINITKTKSGAVFVVGPMGPQKLTISVMEQ